MNDLNNQYDRITEILRNQSTPTEAPLRDIDYYSQAIGAFGGGGPQAFLDGIRSQQRQTIDDQRQAQADEVSREMGILDIFERQKAAGDANAKALDEKIKLFTGDDPEGMAIFLEALHNDPEDIDPGNSYQVMTKLASIAKQTGYKSPAMKKKATMDAVNTEIMNRLGVKGEPKSVKNNNPGNMRPVGQSEGFQAFSSPQEGLQAMESDLLAKIGGKSKIMSERYGKGYTPTLQAIIETWAPPSENDTSNYVNFVSQKTGIQPGQVLSPMDVKKLIPAMIEMEGGQDAAQYYNTAPTGMEMAQTDTQMNDGVDDVTQLQVMAALANDDQEGALKILADAQTGGKAQSSEGKLEADYRKGLITKETYDAALNKSAGKKPIPATALKMQNEALDAVGAASAINADLNQIVKTIDSGKLNLGPIDNLVSMGLNYTGNSTENSRNFATFKNTLEKLRNESLRLNKGVQTEGDAVRIWNEIVTNMNDVKLVSERLKEIQGINQRALQLRKLEVDNIRANYGYEPIDYSKYENQTSAVMKDNDTSDVSSLSDDELLKQLGQ